MIYEARYILIAGYAYQLDGGGGEGEGKYEGRVRGGAGRRLGGERKGGRMQEEGKEDGGGIVSANIAKEVLDPVNIRQ